MANAKASQPPAIEINQPSAIQALEFDRNIERRAALDLGSGSFKLLVADVDTRTQEIVKCIFGEMLRVPLSDALAPKSAEAEIYFDEKVQEKALEALTTLIKHANEYKPSKFTAIATSAFRKASNGEAFAEKISALFDLRVHIAPQDEEARLGFNSVIALSKADPDHAVVWDIGSGSFQISWKDHDELRSYQKEISKVFTRSLVLQIQGKELTDDASPNPVFEKDCAAAKAALLEVFSDSPKELYDHLQDPETRVYGIGAVHNSNIVKAAKKPIYTLEDVEALLESRFGLDDSSFDEPFPAPRYRVSDLIFVTALMSSTGMTTVFDVKQYTDPAIPIEGNTAGILITPKYW